MEIIAAQGQNSPGVPPSHILLPGLQEWIDFFDQSQGRGPAVARQQLCLRRRRASKSLSLPIIFFGPEAIPPT